MSRKSSFLMRARKVKQGERVELTHLESRSTGRFASLDEAISWVRAKWTEWDATPVDEEKMPAMPAERSGGMKRLSDNAWIGQGLRRGEALALAVAVLVLAVIAGDPGVRGAVSDGATQLSAASPSLREIKVGTTISATLVNGGKGATYARSAFTILEGSNYVVPGSFTEFDFNDSIGVCFLSTVTPLATSSSRSVFFVDSATLPADLTVKPIAENDLVFTLCKQKTTAAQNFYVIGAYVFGPGLRPLSGAPRDIHFRIRWSV